jgi:AcrR family transcriptional regulator
VVIRDRLVATKDPVGEVKKPDLAHPVQRTLRDLAAIDGRTARALRTREAIVDASIALVDEGDLRPTAPRIAERAKVSVRSVFQHFDDLEGLYAAVGDRLVERLSYVGLSIDHDAALDRRIPDVVHHRAALLEAITPIRRAATVHAPFSREVRARLQAGHDFLRTEVEQAFEGELDALAPAERAITLDALDTVMSWVSWDSLRTLNGRSVDEARDVLVCMVSAILRSQ